MDGRGGWRFNLKGDLEGRKRHNKKREEEKAEDIFEI